MAKRIPWIPLLIQESNFQLKNEDFNANFSKQYSPIKNNNRMPSGLLLATGKSVGSAKSFKDDILSVIRKQTWVKILMTIK